MISETGGTGLGAQLNISSIRIFLLLDDFDRFFKGWRGEDHVSICREDDGTPTISIPFNGMVEVIDFDGTVRAYTNDPKGTLNAILGHIKDRRKKDNQG